MFITNTGGVEIKCAKCGNVFRMNSLTFIHSTIQERVTCKQCLGKGGKKKK